MPNISDAADFNPRHAALFHAAEAETNARAHRTEAPVGFGEAVTALVCGLIYVGDQVRRLADMREAELRDPLNPLATQ